MGIVVPQRSIRFRSIREKRAVDRQAPGSPAPRELRRRLLGPNAPLRCLAGDSLAAHFHKWRGASGQCYIFSVFPVLANEVLGGLPEFDGAVAVAVARDAGGKRRRVAVLDLRWLEGQFCGDAEAVGAALRSGVSEWHVHLLAKDEKSRHAVIVDMTS
ncbi:hypothetical protein MPC4_100011 [Methylocella tundrae]|uniref:Uncharacterized protein n=1 Tax=Methylocella tundrae TaxID=227605 RepID=A0A8B6M170_METTU|nr:hypothetical protein MPC4_100011 [Methylocella tundrae]